MLTFEQFEKTMKSYLDQRRQYDEQILQEVVEKTVMRKIWCTK